MKNNIIRQKDDLSTGMLVRFRNGEHCYVLIDVQVFSGRGYSYKSILKTIDLRSTYSLDYYDDDERERAVAALAVRIGGAVLLTRARWGGDMADVVSAVAGCLVGLALVAWALVRVQRNRDLATAQPEPARYPGHELIGVVEPPQSASPGPAVSPSTPVAAPQPASHGQWRTATTPWPRADEDDPHGTLIRPPRR